MDIKHFQESLGYKFKNESLLKTALTHSSYANEKKSKGVNNNERLEFLGDSVLNLIVSDYIFKSYPDLPEGNMTKIRSSVVCESMLKDLSSEISIGNYILLGKGEELTGGRKRASILADAFEAVIGAIYSDGGFEEAKKFVYDNLIDKIKSSANGAGMFDYKTRLQEILQKNGDVKIKYEIISEEGPDHDKKFTVQVVCDGNTLGKGVGRSKKEAEQSAAKSAIELVEE